MLKFITMKSNLLKKNVKNITYDINNDLQIEEIKRHVFKENIFSIDSYSDWYKNNNRLDEYYRRFEFLFNNKKGYVNTYKLWPLDENTLYKLCFQCNEIYDCLNQAIDEVNAFPLDRDYTHLWNAGDLIAYIEYLSTICDDLVDSSNISKAYYDHKE